MIKFVESFPKAIAVLSFAILAMAACHELGYFFIVGSQFQTFASGYDYLANAIVYLPFYVLAIAGAISIAIFLANIIPSNPPNAPKKLRGIYFLPVEMYFLPALLLLTTISAFFLATPITFYAATSITAGSALAFIALPSITAKRKQLGLNRIEVFILVMLPVVFAAMISFGVLEANSDLTSTDYVYSLQYKETKLGQARSNLNVKLLRTFEKGLLVQSVVDKGIEFIRWDEVASINSTKAPLNKTSLGCIKYGVFCKAMLGT